jgi:hypothetical protein
VVVLARAEVVRVEVERVKAGRSGAQHVEADGVADVDAPLR